MKTIKKIDKELVWEYYSHLKGTDADRDQFHVQWGCWGNDEKRSWTYESYVWQEEGDDGVLSL